MNDFFDNQRILQVIWRRKFHFIVVGAIAVLLSAIFSGPAFIKPKFKSTARVYPTNNVALFSEESESEQLLEIINSRDIKLKMFDVFNLSEAYTIDRNDPQYLTYMFDTDNKNGNAGKTKFETVEITVMDYEPQRASDMCDSLIRFFNQKLGEMHSIKHMEVIELTEKYIDEKSAELDSVSDLLQQLRNKTGIISVPSQLERVTEGYMNALSGNRGGNANIQQIKELLDNFNVYGAQISILEKKFNKYNGIIDSLQTIKQVQILEAGKNITYSHIVESPIPADKKSYPVRWLIVAFSTMAAVFLAFLVFLILDYRKND
jgi:uncharacterized protein involved in exopolysaccharide biosynthesis